MKQRVSIVVLSVLLLCSQALGQGQAPAVSAFERQVVHAWPVPLDRVRLTGGPLKAAQDVTVKYLLELEPDRMMAGYRLRAGLEPRAEGYGGWDSVNGRQLTGHIAGHYLSAISLMYAATGNEEFKKRADYLVKEMKEVQDKQGDGYLGALLGNRPGAQRGGGAPGPENLMDGKELFVRLSQGEIRSGGFDLNGMWSPWYTLHKTYAGLRDAYRFTDNKTALQLEIKFAAWAEKVLAPLSDAQIQQMLNTEFGGMNEVLVDLYADTGDKRWLDLSYKFEHRSFIEPLEHHIDNLNGKHGNTQVPKLIGSADRFGYTGAAGDIIAAGFFWDRVVQHHTFATGGHGQGEYFHEADHLDAIKDGRTCESCNVYNMLKLTRRLFEFEPDAHYADFLERALFNHILASIDPNDGRTCYMVPVGQGVEHEYQDMFGGFTCCVGTGMESHALHADGIYYETGDKVWVNIYAPSAADCTVAGVKVAMDTDFPEGESATIKLTVSSPKELTLALRKPYWAGDGFSVKVNGEVVPADVVDPYRNVPGSGRAMGLRRGGGPEQARRPQAPQGPSSFVELKRTWKTGDTIEVTLPKTLYTEPTSDNPHVAAIMWGPLVMAGDIGPESRGGRRGRGAEMDRPTVPVFVAADQEVSEWLKPVAGQPGMFRSAGVGRDNLGAGRQIDAVLVPFYRLHNRLYAIYWDLFTQDEWEQKKAEYAAEQERQRKLRAATVAFAQPGEMQPERDYNFQIGDENARPARAEGRPGRSTRSWFSFDLPVDAAHPMKLVVTYYSMERRRDPASFEIQVEGRRVSQQQLESSEPARFFDVEYAIPADLIQGKQKVTVRFQADEGGSVAGVYGIRMIRADAEL
ncbi:MAG: glycoside hydrolase family 127 protein [Sedimentisphaerales bacterium]|nr:glycoside hydrolase family 127 protein [Sedimentisphaerales bacterium]